MPRELPSRRVFELTPKESATLRRLPNVHTATASEAGPTGQATLWILDNGKAMIAPLPIPEVLRLIAPPAMPWSPCDYVKLPGEGEGRVPRESAPKGRTAPRRSVPLTLESLGLSAGADLELSP